MTIKKLSFFICIAIIGFSATRATAVTLFSDTFDTPASSGLWTVNTAPTGATVASQQSATFAFDYSTMGIPAAPGNAPTDTFGLRLRANVPGTAAAPVTTRPAQTTSGLSVSPTGQSFGTSYQLSFYAWSNFFGAPNASGLADNGNSQGGTNNVLFAVGTSGTVPLVVANTALAVNGAMDGIGFATTGDGGIPNDYRVYPKSGTFVPGTTAGVYAAGADATAVQNTNTYYTTTVTTLGAHTAPAGQQAIATAEFGGDAAPVMAGSTQPGAFGFAWHKVDIKKNGGIVTWKIDDFLIATFDASSLTLGGSNIALGESDVNNTTAQHPALVFTVFDNLTVTDVPATGVLGDFNSDGKVDASDYAIWRKNEIANAALPNQGTAANQADRYTLWRSNYGNPPGAGAGELLGASVPEPSSLLLLLLSAGCCCWTARSRS